MSKDSNYDKQESNNRKKVSYLYVLSSPNEGEFTISEAKAMVDGKMIKSKPLNIKIHYRPVKVNKKFFEIIEI